MNPLIVKYQIKIAGKRLLSALQPTRGPAGGDAPSVTLFISSLNTRYPLELTLRSLAANTSYPNYRLLIGENASTDGSREMLDELEAQGRVELIRAAGPRLHSIWLDEVMATVQTTYWCAVDSDMLFLGRDWLWDLIRRMEAEPDLDLLGAEQRPYTPGYVEPVGKETIDVGESPATWLFCVRTSLRTRLKSSFAFHKAGINPQTGRMLVYDTGGKLLIDMRDAGLKYAFMPNWFLHKYHHFGSLSWAPNADTEDQHTQLKKYQMEDIRRRLKAGS